MEHFNMPVQTPNVQAGSEEGQGDAEKKPACKACCACPDTKRVRDAW